MTQEEKVLPIEQLKEFEGNPNAHPQKQVEALARSMKKYGQYYPVICDEKHTILAGHGKVLALKHLGETTVKVIIMKGLSEKDKKKLVIEDNKIQSMGVISFTRVEEIIKEIGDSDIIGYDTSYLDVVLAETQEAINNLPDNMGVNLSEPVKVHQEFKEEERQEAIAEIEDIDEGMEVAKSYKCPHCGKEISF